jgi:GT2 family glycosyltransferase
MPRVAFIIVSYNTRALLDACLASIYQHVRGVTFEIVVVDNASSDDSVALVREKYPEALVVESGQNLGFGRANNLGVSRTRAPFVLLLNSDTVLLADTASHLVQFLERNPAAGLAGPAVTLMDGTRQPKTCGMLPSASVMVNQNLLLSRLFPRSRFFAGLYVENEWAPEMRIGWISGVCMLIRREAYEQCGGFDPAIFMYAEDIDLCRRCAAAGWETWRVNHAVIRHVCGGSTKSDVDLLRHRVLQQRNFLRLIDASMGPTSRMLTRWSFGVGLLLRAIIRGGGSLLGGSHRQLAFRADLHCLKDLLGCTRNLPAHDHAHRA